MGFLAELKRRNVYKIAAVYIVASWLLLQIADTLFPAFDMPISSLRILAVMLLFAFPVVLIITWAFELTPEGFRKSSDTAPPTSSKRINLKFTLALLASGVVIIGGLMAIPTSRMWLTETGVNAAMNAASAVTSLELEKELGITVLPFVNMSSDAENEYFSDGISEEILNALVHTSRMPVIARTSSFQFKGQNQDIKKIGDLLGVTHILEGSVRKSNGQVRITAQLIDTSTGAHLWSDTYDRELADIFALQDEIAGMIVEQIGNTLQGEERERFYVEMPSTGDQGRGTTNLEAHQALLRGLQLANIDNPFEKEKALAWFDRAIELDEDYVDAWFLKGATLMGLGSEGVGLRIPAEVNPLAMTALVRALELDPNHAPSMGTLGLLKISQDFQWREGMLMMEQSLALSPNNGPLLSAYGWILLNTRQENAVDVVERAYRLNPLDPRVILARAGMLVKQGKVMDAATLANAGVLNNQEGYGANYVSSILNIAVGRLELAQTQLDKAALVVGEDYPSLVIPNAMMAANRDADFESQNWSERILQQAQTHRVPFLLVIWPWQGEQLEQAWDIALSQRDPEVMMFLFSPKPLTMSDDYWQHVRQVTRADQVSVGELTGLFDRSENEQKVLMARVIELDPAVLARYVGKYQRTDRDQAFDIVFSQSDGGLRNQLNEEWLPIGEQRFTLLHGDVELEFTLEQGEVTGYRFYSGQQVFEAKRLPD